MMKEEEPLVLDRTREQESAPKPCCCCLDVRVGTVLIGLFNLVFHSASFILASQVIAHPKAYRDDYGDFGSHRMPGDNFVGMSLALFSFLITVMLIYGALMRKPGLILPFFAIQVFDVVLFILGAAGAITYGADLKLKLETCPTFLYRNEVSKMSIHNFMFVLVSTCLIIMLFKVYLMSCVWECYSFVKRQIERPSHITIYPNMLDDPILPNYEEAIKMPKEMPPPYSTSQY